MTWVLVLSFMANGHPNFHEPRAFTTESECKAALERSYDLYIADGISLNFVRGGCYLLTERGK